MQHPVEVEYHTTDYSIDTMSSTARRRPSSQPRVPLSNIQSRANASSPTRSISSKGSRSTVSSFKLKSSVHDTRPIHGTSKLQNINQLQPPSSTHSTRRNRQMNKANAGIAASTLNESVNEMKNSREEARLRLEWAKQRGAAAEGDIMRQDESTETSNQQPQPKPRTRQQLHQPQKVQQAKNQKGEQLITMTESQIQQMIQNRVERSENETIMALKKQLDDLKFLQELEKEKSEQETVMGQLDNNVPPPPSPLQEQVSKLQLQLQTAESTIKTLNDKNTSINMSLSNLKEENIDLEAKLQVLSPNHDDISTPEAYKKALRLQSDLLNTSNLYQEEILLREKAEKEKNEMKSKIEELERTIEERNRDLDDGVVIVKGLEQEVEEMEELLEKERTKVKEVNVAMAKYKEESIDRFEKEKIALEAQCEGFVLEIKEMKVRVKDMEAIRAKLDIKMKTVEEMESIIEELNEEHKQELNALETEHNERVKAYQQSLDGKVSENKQLLEKIASMEVIVSEYHEKARGEIKTYLQQVQEAQQHEMEAREALQEALTQLEEYEETCTMMENEIIELKESVAGKEKDLLEANKKAKDHQHMREKKRWMTMEKSLRQELQEANEKLKGISVEQNEVDGVLTNIGEENKALKIEIESLIEKNKDYKQRILTNENESRSRIKSLEQELFRLQKSFPEKEKKEIWYQNDQDESINGEVKDAARGFTNDIPTKPISLMKNKTTSLKIDDDMLDLAWDEAQQVSFAAPKEPKERDRQSIENDAIRKYMKQRRTR